MSKSNIFEQTMQPDYPSGDTEAQYIDDIFRAIKQAQEDRLDQEHYWRSPDDSNYDVGMEGAHRPESARVFSSETSVPESGPLFQFKLPTDFPSAQPPKQYEGLLVAADGTGELVGSLWRLVGNKLKSAVKRLRGMVFVNGRLILRKSRYVHGAMAHGSGVYIDEPDYTSGNDYTANNLSLVPFIAVDRGRQVGQGTDDSRTFKRLIFPVFVGPFNGSGTYDASQIPAGHKLGVEFVLGDPTNSSSTRVVFSEEGIEVFGSIQKFYVNGVDVANHDHSGAVGMGKRLNLLDLLPPDQQSRLSAYLEAEQMATTSSIIRTNQYSPLPPEIEFTRLCPADEFDDRQADDTKNRFLYVLKLAVQLNGTETADRQVAWKFKLEGQDIATGARIVRLGDVRDPGPWCESFTIIPARMVQDINTAKITVHAVAMGSNDISVTGVKLRVKALVLKL